ncbi:hypothetical protein DL93DRAFT_2228099 [Clavulina sp. PMI_390]|nr:hypothetical protein DL93DRAFT_2228099 [Clavulina sp. PMI_390]
MNSMEDSSHIMHSDIEPQLKSASIHNSLQPFMNLPTEIISSIFLFASSRRDDPEYPAILKGYKDVLLREALPSCSFVSLNLLCKQARQIALNSPRCWKDVLMFIKNNQVMNTPSSLVHRLHRSKEAPMNLFFHTIYPNSLGAPRESVSTTADQVINIQTLELLGPHVHRCQHITFYIPDIYLDYHPGHISRILHSFSWTYPSLRHLTVLDHAFVEGNLPYSFDWDQFSSHVDQTTITCVELKFRSFSGDVLTTGNLIAPLGVTHLQVSRGYSPNDVMDFLRRATRLENLDWDGYNPRESPDMWAEDHTALPTILPNLLSLRLRTQARHPGSCGLVAPKCEELYMHELRRLWSKPPPVFKPYWDSLEFPRLGRFSISRPDSNGRVDNDVVWDNVRNFLDRHPTLQDVFVYAPYRDDSQDPGWSWVFSYLTKSPQSQQATASSSGPNSHPFMQPSSNINSLPNLRNLWFEIKPRPWRDKFWSMLIVFIKAILLFRPDVTIHLWPHEPLFAIPISASDKKEGNLSPFPPDLDLLAAEFGSQREGVASGVTGRLKLLSSREMVVWPKAWGFLYPYAG